MGSLAISFPKLFESIKITKEVNHLSNELPSLGNDESQDHGEHGYYDDDDDDSDFDLDDAMRNLVLWQIFEDMSQEERNGFLIVDVLII